VSRVAADPGPNAACRFLVAGWMALLLGLNTRSAASNTPGVHPLEPLAKPGSRAGFTLLAPSQTGVWFTNTLSPTNAAENQIRLNGSGVALGDVDGDGRCDVFLSALEGRVALYRNLGGWRFTNIAGPAGLDFAGGYSTGAAFADVDGDGDLDLLLNGIGTGTRLFRNDGHGHFTEAPDAGLLHRFGATTSTLADVDGDGDLDLYVANYRTNTVRSTGFALLNVGGRRMVQPQDRGHLELTPEGRVLEQGEPSVLYRNDGSGRFRPASWTDGTFVDEDGRVLTRPPFDWGLSCAFRDLNQDGAPDLYVCNDFHSPDRIWLNDGRGHFRAAPRLAFRHTATFSMAADFADVDRDGWDDLLVSDMTSRERGRRLMQIAGMDPYDIRVGVFDDRPQLDRTVLQWNRGDGTYAEVASYAGLENSEWNWSVLFLDVDLDGFEDLLAATGHMYDTQDLDALARIAAKGPYPREMIPWKLFQHPPLLQAKLAFRNRGDLTFEECGRTWGFDQVGVSQGMALGDLDNDGDLDLVVNNLNGAAGFYRNDSSAPRVAVRLRGQPPNTAGIGARITMRGGPVTQSQEMMAGGRYLSGDEALRVFAAGTSGQTLQIEVRWRSGRRSLVTNAPPDRLYVIEEPASDSDGVVAGPEPNGDALTTPVPEPWFEDVSGRLNHRHHEAPFDDFARQPLLPRRLSQGGPGVSWFDLDADGHDDLVVGDGRGGALGVFRNLGSGRFECLVESPWTNVVAGDLTTVLGWRPPGATNGLAETRGDAGGRARLRPSRNALGESSPARREPRPTNAVVPHDASVLLAGFANYESPTAASPSVLAYSSSDRGAVEAIPGFPSSVSPLALADYDADGQLDLFVGGRCLPGRYPEPADSQLWHGRDGGWVLDVENTSRLKGVGMVSGAMWTDLTGDGWPELLLACEWGPLKVFRNERGRLTPWDLPVRLAASEGQAGGSEALKLSHFSGWWNGVASGDFDGDGALDFLATNWGLNTIYHASNEVPLSLYYGDFDDSGTIQMIEAVRDPNSGVDVPNRDLDALAKVMPWLRARFTTHAAFGQATVKDLLGAAFPRTRRVEVTTLTSMLFLNRTSHFVAIPLPREAQFAPAFAVCVGDFNGDGREDAFLSQNFFATQPKVPRCDAGLGLWLEGDGRGGFRAVPARESGVRVYGEQRGAALADYDGDGRVDLVVTQNGNATKLYRNVRGNPGLRVRLEGPPGNPTGVGAVLQLLEGEWKGPARELHAGSGYWSQDSPVTVLGSTGRPSGLLVRWPGGQVSRVRLSPGRAEATIRQGVSPRL